MVKLCTELVVYENIYIDSIYVSPNPCGINEPISLFISCINPSELDMTLSVTVTRNDSQIGLYELVFNGEPEKTFEIPLDTESTTGTVSYCVEY